MIIFYIMYKNEMVVKISFRNQQLKINEIKNIKYLPLHIANNIENITESIAQWLNHRIIPNGRENIEVLLKDLKSPSRFSLSMKSYSASLSDPYWIKPVESSKRWEDINFFSNFYDYDIGNAIFGIKNKSEISYISPDSTTNGQLRKAWRKIDGKDFLYKVGAFPDFQEAINEVFSSKIAAKIEGLDFVSYRLAKIGSCICSVCENFVSEEEEFVPAYSIYQSEKKEITSTIYDHLIYCCDKLGIEKAREFIDKMMVFDYMIANTDRHMGNFGFMRDTNTLKFTRPAPLFDNGTSLWVDTNISVVKNRMTEMKIFDDSKKFIISIKNLDFLNLCEIKNEITELRILFDEIGIKEERKEKVCELLIKRINEVANIKEKKYHQCFNQNKIFEMEK